MAKKILVPVKAKSFPRKGRNSSSLAGFLFPKPFRNFLFPTGKRGELVGGRWWEAKKGDEKFSLFFISAECDKFFFDIDSDESWQLVSQSEKMEYEGTEFSFCTYKNLKGGI